MSEQPFMDRCLVLEARVKELEGHRDRAVELLRAVYTRDGFGLMNEIDAFLATCAPTSATPDPSPDSPP